MTKVRLTIARPEQVRYACLFLHYARSVPAVKLAFACYEDDRFIGVICFGYGANNNLARSFGLVQGQVLELVRVALGTHEQPTSQYVALAIKLLRRRKPLVKLLISYADKTTQNHKGIIYQATNWLYLGIRTANKDAYYDVEGKLVHGRSMRSRYGNKANFPEYKDVSGLQKHIYAYPFTKVLRQELESKAVSFHDTEGGAVPTLTHQGA